MIFHLILLFADSSAGGCLGGSPAWVRGATTWHDRLLPFLAEKRHLLPHPNPTSSPAFQQSADVVLPARCLWPGMFSEAYFVFSVGNLKNIWKAEYPE